MRKVLLILFLFIAYDAASAAETTVRFVQSGTSLHSVFPATIRLPHDVAKRIRNGQINDSDGTVILDNKRGNFFRYERKFEHYTEIVEGVRNTKKCIADNIFGTNEPRYIGPQSENSDRNPIRVFSFTNGCVGYQVSVRCNSGRRPIPNECVHALHNLQNINYPSYLPVVPVISSPNYQNIKTAEVPVSLAESGAISKVQGFSYVEPGVLRFRQYVRPENCNAEILHYHHYADFRNPYSRIVFAGPNVMTRFPIDLDRVPRVTLNSQVFGPGGYFFLARANLVTPRQQHLQNFAETADDLFVKCNGGDKEWKNWKHKFRYEQTGANNNPKYGFPGSFQHYQNDLNFSGPWSDNFCEYRGRDTGAFFFCGQKNNKHVSGTHYGVDIRGPSNDLKDEVPAIAVTDGVIVQVSENGSVVKIRSTIDPDYLFSYRHMDVEKSPFNTGKLKLGDHVNAGTVIGFMHSYMMGAARKTSKHLHFEIQLDTPTRLLSGCTTREPGKTPYLTCGAPLDEYVPPYASLVVAYLKHRFGYQPDLTKSVDKDFNLPLLPELPWELTHKKLEETNEPTKVLARPK